MKEDGVEISGEKQTQQRGVQKAYKAANKVLEEKVAAKEISKDDPSLRLFKLNFEFMEQFRENGYKRDKRMRFDPLVLSFAVGLLVEVGNKSYDTVALQLGLPTF